ncbi:DUF305 domain-containing protein [Micromonospora sp. DT233]|uniref:DUF305 domain-containing protein n=1 Tax=Micromonospora sp. DT233 TaxID=3393432 RepID=UPI003CE69784
MTRTILRRTSLRRTVLAALGLTVAIALAGCGGDDDHGSTGGAHSPAPAGPTASSSQGGNPGTGNATDVMFAQMMIPHHQQAVQMADLAATRAVDPEVKQLAAQIKAAQGPEIETMTGWLTAWGTPASAGMKHGASPHVMPSMDHEMPGMMTEADMAKLAEATGTAFDKRFLTMMIAHHEGAITMARDETKGGANADAKALAARIIEAQQAEIGTMNKILARL